MKRKSSASLTQPLLLVYMTFNIHDPENLSKPRHLKTISHFKDATNILFQNSFLNTEHLVEEQSASVFKLIARRTWQWLESMTFQKHIDNNRGIK